MLKKSSIITGFILLGLGFILMIVLCISSSSKFESRNEKLAAEIGSLKDLLRSTQRSVDTLKHQTPGLGEYMTTIQLHISKLWFAAKNMNWGLAKYEFDELAETIEAAESLHAIQNNVDISAVLQSLRNAQLPSLGQTITQKDNPKFKEAYGQTLTACNGCHAASGHEYIHIIPPIREPVTNQLWTVFRSEKMILYCVWR